MDPAVSVDLAPDRLHGHLHAFLDLRHQVFINAELDAVLFEIGLEMRIADLHRAVGRRSGCHARACRSSCGVFGLRCSLGARRDSSRRDRMLLRTF